MRHQTMAEMEDAVASPPSISLKSRSRVSPAIIGIERPLPNGDIYSGELAGSAPHGYGKYIWIDGCVYVGEWINGWASGKGKLSWPSGATYEGDFKNGRMEGHGTFTGSSGETYHGCWIADRKHGYGKKSYGNGDFYEGQWRRDLQEGQGRYVWRNGNEYVGEWRSGMISGRGVLALANGDRCDGHWENGVPKRNGVFAWPDCSCYRNCNRDSKSRKQIDQTSFSTSMSSMKQLRNIPGLGMMELEFDEGDFASLLSGSEFGNTGEAARQTQTQWRDNTGDVKMMGQAVFKGHKSYGLVLGFQLGIRYTVGKTISKQLARLWPSDFDSREKVWTRFPSGGSKKTPPHHSADFKWKDYCPRVFRHLRRLFGVDPEAYVESICGIDSIRELASPGKSGSLFFQTQDGRFIIKTVKKCEVKILIRMLLNYYQHVYKYEDSLLTKYYGVHCVKPIGGQKVRFIVMGNLFCSELVIHRRFDLKGSSHGRSIRMGEEEVDETTTLKDLDLNFVFHLQKPWFKKVMWQIELDCELLEAEGIMDYSLLVGLHFNNDDKSAPQCKWDDDSELYHESALKSEVSSYTHKSFQSRENLIEFSFPESGKWDAAKLMDAREPAIRVGAGVPARAVEHAFHVSGSPEQAILLAPPRGKNYEVTLYFGIIDILRDYDISKRLEHAYKSLQADPLSISAVDPKLYSRRFRDFIGRVFVDDVEPDIVAYL